jgi:hypothetical protein
MGQALIHKRHPLHNSRSISTFPFLAMRSPRCILPGKSGFWQYTKKSRKTLGDCLLTKPVVYSILKPCR